MYHRQRYDHTHPIFKDHRILKIHDIINLKSILFVHGAINTYPIDCKFEVIPRTIGNSYNFRIPLCRTTHAQQSIRVRGARFWNKLPDDLKNTTSRACLKSQLVKNYFHEYSKQT